MPLLDVDVAVVGAGGAGLYTALTAAREGARVALISATPLAQTASYWAQGGIAAALAVDDSPRSTSRTPRPPAAGLTRRSAAEVLVTTRRRPSATSRGSACASTPTATGRSASASRAVTASVAWCTPAAARPGRRVVRDLSAIVASEPRITVLEAARAADLWCHDGRVAGVLFEESLAIRARATIVSAGGAAALWSRTTNPPGSTGAGMVLAHRAGAELADLEFLQFHPTAVTGVPGREGFLVTEAIRGEGATLHGPDGERFVEELAPRDEVALAIYTKLQETGAPSVGLDMRMIDPASFPNVVQALSDAGWTRRAS
jgi:L-aspartate oxidase